MTRPPGRPYGRGQDPGGGSEIHHIDDETLREVLDDRLAAEQRLSDLEAAPDAHEPGVRGERIGLLRLLGRLEEAERLAREAVAGTVGDGRRNVAATIRLAHVLQCRGRFAEADELFVAALNRADALDDDRLRAFAHQHLGKSLFDQGQFAAAAERFKAALRIREAIAAPGDQIASSRQALAAATRRAD